ncbi:MAG TPA: YqiA/YcfP family alpha/beta fold hydrolase [Stenomitos sp.]
MNYLYLHGFASGPSSVKLLYLRECFAADGIALQTPDLNQNDFFNLTLTRQIQQCEALFAANPQPWTIVGSSLGGLTAAWLGQRNATVARLILLAPAFEFLPYWQQQLGAEQLTQWQQTGQIEVYHHAVQRSLPLSYQFWLDAQRYKEVDINRAVPTLILHGTEDEVIPVEASRRYAAQRPWSTLVELQCDHGMINNLPQIWEQTRRFCGLLTA